MEISQPTPTNTPSTPAQPTSFFAKYKFTLISLLIIIVAAIPLFVLSNKKPATQETTQQAVMFPTLTVEPLTQSNADQKLNEADQQMQQTLNQVDVDLQAVNQINTSQDSTTGL